MFVKILNVVRADFTNGVIVKFFYTLRRSIHPIRDVRRLDDSQNLLGKWMGEIPEKGKWYDVEIAVEGELVWEKSVFPAESDDAYISSDSKGGLILQGHLEVSEDGFSTLAIGKSLNVLEKIVNIPLPFRGFVRVLADSIVLYDTGILK